MKMIEKGHNSQIVGVFFNADYSIMNLSLSTNSRDRWQLTANSRQFKSRHFVFYYYTNMTHLRCHMINADIAVS